MAPSFNSATLIYGVCILAQRFQRVWKPLVATPHSTRVPSHPKSVSPVHFPHTGCKSAEHRRTHTSPIPGAAAPMRFGTPVAIHHSRRVAQIGSCACRVHSADFSEVLGACGQLNISQFLISRSIEILLESCALVPDLICQKWLEIETLGVF